MAFTVLAVDAAEKSDQIKAFWKNHFTGWQPGKLDWFYLKNPQGKTKCWVIVNEENEEIIGSVVVFPRQFYFNGNEIAAGITGDFGVSKNYRILGPALKLQKNTLELCETDGYQFLYGFPNNKSEPVQKRAGYSVIGASRRLVKILNSREYIQRKTGSSFLAVLAAPVINFILKLSAPENRKSLKKDYHEQTELHFDSTFDDLWHEARNRYKLIGNRGSTFLNWRFADCPFRRFRLYALKEKETNKLIGYIVYYIENKTVFISDMFALDIKNSMDALLTGFLKNIRKKDVNSISVLFFGSSGIIGRLKEFGFSEREDRRNVVAYVQENNPLREICLDEENWYFFEADND